MCAAPGSLGRGACRSPRPRKVSPRQSRRVLKSSQSCPQAAPAVEIGRFRGPSFSNLCEFCLGHLWPTFVQHLGAAMCWHTRVRPGGTERFVPHYALKDASGRCESRETWLEHFTHNRQQARSMNEETGHHLWVPLALKRQLTFAGHVERLSDDRMVKVAC